jgi:hypothetical protein
MSVNKQFIRGAFMRKTIVFTAVLFVLALGTGDASAAKVGRGTVDYVCGKGVNSCSKCMPKCYDYECKGNKCTMVLVGRTAPHAPKTGITPVPGGAKQTSPGATPPSHASGKRH